MTSELSSASQLSPRSFRSFPKAYSSLGLSAHFRSVPEDFVVNEELGFAPSGEGEHWLLHIEKIGQNTHWVAEQLAHFCGLDPSSVGVCGRKDRHAVTRQWFSLYAPKQTPIPTSVNWDEFELEGVNILEVHRHSKKLRLGSHQANEFNIRLRDLTVNTEKTNNEKTTGEKLSEQEKATLSEEIHRRMAIGVPNYFGEQRFGRGNSNLLDAQQWFEVGRKPHRKRKSMVMSAARAYLFNAVLAARVEQDNWKTELPGDVLENNFPTGPLWGRGRALTSEDSRALEVTAFTGLEEWCRGLEHCGLKQERRSLMLLPEKFNLIWLGDDLQLSFSLPVGTFATTLLAELTELISCQGDSKH